MPTYVKITDLPDVPISLTGEELLEIVQGGTSYSATTQQIANLGGGGGGAVTSVAGRTGAVTLTSNDLTDATTTGQALITAASQTAARTALGLGDLATVTPGSGVATALAANLNSTNGLMALDGAGNANFPSLASAFSALYIGTEPHTISIGASSGTAAWVNTDGSFSLSGGNLVGDTSGNVTMFGNILASNGDKWADVNNRIIYDQYNEQAISTVSDTWNTDYLTTLISDPDYGYVAINGQLFVRNSIQVQPFGGSSVTQLNYDGSASFANGYVTIDTSGDVQIVNQSLIVSNTGNEAVMRLSEKSNGEVTWAYNVNPNNSDSLDNTTDMAWKFAMAGVNSTSSINIQSSPANSDSWTGTKLWSISATGALYMDSGVIITDGSGNMQWGNGEAGYITVINSSGELQYPSGDQLLTDTAGRLYYSTGVTLADNAANLYYGNGTSKLSDSNSQLYYGDGSNLTVNDSGLYLIYPTVGTPIADFAGRLYYGDGNVMTDPTVTPQLLNYPGLGSGHPIADSYGVLYWGGDGGGHPLADNYDILYLRGGLQDMTASNGLSGQVLTSDGTNATWQYLPDEMGFDGGLIYSDGMGDLHATSFTGDGTFLTGDASGLIAGAASSGWPLNVSGYTNDANYLAAGSEMNFDSGAITSDGLGDINAASFSATGNVNIGPAGSLYAACLSLSTSENTMLNAVQGPFMVGLSDGNNVGFNLGTVGPPYFNNDNSTWAASIQATQWGVTNDVTLYLQPFGGNVLIGAVPNDDLVHNLQIAGSSSLDSGEITSDGSGNLTAVSFIGSTFSLKGGSNARSGTVTLASGVGSVTSTAITTSDVIVMSLKTSSGTPGTYAPLATVSAGSIAFSGLATDNSTYNWAALLANQ